MAEKELEEKKLVESEIAKAEGQWGEGLGISLPVCSILFLPSWVLIIKMPSLIVPFYLVFLSHGSRTDVSNGAGKHGKDHRIPKRCLLHRPTYPSYISHIVSTGLALFLCLANAKAVQLDSQPVKPTPSQTFQFIRTILTSLISK